MVYETGNLEPCLAGFVRNHIETVVIPLHPQLVLSSRAELVKPGALYVVVIVVDRTAGREGCQIVRPGFAPGRVSSDSLERAGCSHRYGDRGVRKPSNRGSCSRKVLPAIQTG